MACTAGVAASAASGAMDSSKQELPTRRVTPNGRYADAGRSPRFERDRSVAGLDLQPPAALPELATERAAVPFVGVVISRSGRGGDVEVVPDSAIAGVSV